MANRYQERAFAADDHYGRQNDHARVGGEPDPLAELARLIGQADPLSNFGRQDRGAGERREPVDFDAGLSARLDQYDAEPQEPVVHVDDRPSWMRRSNVVEAQPEPEMDTEMQSVHPLHRHVPSQATAAPQFAQSYQPSPALADDEYVAARHQPEPMPAPYNADANRYDDALFGKMPEPQYPQHDSYDAHTGYADEYDAPAYQEQPKRRGGMKTVAVVMALAVVGTGAAFSYRAFVGVPTRTGEPPVIRADAGPNKVIPPSANSEAGKVVQDRIAAGQERILSREEKPVNVQQAAVDQPRAVFPPVNQQQAAAPSVTGALNANASAPVADEPRRVRTLSVRGDADGATTPAARQAPARITAPVVTTAPATNSPISLSPQPTRVAAVAPTAVAGTYVVQVASQRSEADAQASFNHLKSRYPSVLGSRTASYRRADLGDKGIYYRAMIGPFNSQDTAAQFCVSLRSAGGQCIVQRN